MTGILRHSWLSAVWASWTSWLWMGFEESCGFIGFPWQQNETRSWPGNGLTLGSYNTKWDLSGPCVCSRIIWLTMLRLSLLVSFFSVNNIQFPIILWKITKFLTSREIKNTQCRVSWFSEWNCCCRYLKIRMDTESVLEISVHTKLTGK